MTAKEYAALGALIVASALSLLSFIVTNDITANMLILIAQFLLYSLTLFGFEELVKYILNFFKGNNKTQVADVINNKEQQQSKTINFKE